MSDQVVAIAVKFSSIGSPSENIHTHPGVGQDERDFFPRPDCAAQPFHGIAGRNVDLGEAVSHRLEGRAKGAPACAERIAHRRTR